MILSCKNIKMEFGAKTVLENISFTLEEGEKAAIVGVNGAGKTTLLKILTGELSPTGGEISLKKDISVGYMAQLEDINPENTIAEELTSVFARVIAAEEDMRALEREMAGQKGAALERSMEKYARLTHIFESGGGFEYKSRVKGVIAGLGFAKDAGLSAGLLSGGQKTRLSLGKLLLSSPDLLLLDEPTNHLDIDSVSWLEDAFLSNYRGSVIMISHDRYFLDKLAAKTVEIEGGKSAVYNGNYSYYAYKKELDRETQLKHYMERQKEIKRQEGIIRMYRSFATEKMLIRAKSKEKLLAKVERLDRPEAPPAKMRIVLEPKIQSGNDVLTVNGLSKSFGDFRLFSGVNFEIKRGEAVALIGANGIGKTTLFKILMGEISGGGSVRKGTNVTMGYFDQERAALDGRSTVFNEISDAYPYLRELEIRNLLAAFVFFGDDVFKEISKLSGGEKGRLALAKIMLGKYNFLLFDEPTNHLDMYSKEILEDAIRGYTGTIFYISHDRYFINNTADRILELGRDGVKSYAGNYDYYVEKKAAERAAAEPEAEDSAAKSNWARKKEARAEARKLQARLDRVEREIAETEAKIRECDEKLTSEEIGSNHVLAGAVYEEKVGLEERLAGLYEEWGELQNR